MIIRAQNGEDASSSTQETALSSSLKLSSWVAEQTKFEVWF